MTAIYSEWDPYPAAWLRNLIAGGHIAEGVVDERSICDLGAADVAGPGQRHFFAGIGGWSVALRLAGVSDDASVWTGSCPCQPLSVAGLQRGASDERHLWPAWYRLIAECRPSVVLGEQASGNAGRAWLAAVRHDLEGLGYAVGAADLAAASVGAPHIRQRIFFGAVLGVGQADDGGGDRQQARLTTRSTPRSTRRAGDDGDRMGIAVGFDAGRNAGAIPGPEAQGGGERIHHRRVGDPARASGGDPWADHELVACHDPKRGLIYRPVPPASSGIFPVAPRVRGDVAQLRASGNAIVAQVAAAFVRSFLGAEAALREACVIASQASYYAHHDIGREFRESIAQLCAIADGQEPK